MATLSDINIKISNLTTTDTNQFANSDRLIDINLWYQKIVGIILDSQDETDFDDARFTGYPKVTIALTTNRDYSISQNLLDSGGLYYSALKIKSLSVAYDGTNFYRATPLDLAETTIGESPASDTTQNATIDANFGRTAPRYSWKNNSIWLYPLATSTDVSNGGKMIVEFERSAAEFSLGDLTSGTASPGFDITFHHMISYGVAYEYCESKGLPQAASLYRELQVYEDRLRRQYSSKQVDRRYQLQMDYQSMK